MKSLLSEQEKAIEKLVQGASHGEAANAAGVSRRTVLRWLKNPEFLEKLQAAKECRRAVTVEVLKERCEISLSELIPKALQAVYDILENPDARAGDKLKAAQLVGSWSRFEESGNPPKSGDTLRSLSPAEKKAEIEALLTRRQYLQARMAQYKSG